MWYLLFASQTSLFVRSGGVFLPGCLVGTATGILVLGMHCTFYLNIDQSLCEEKPATY